MEVNISPRSVGYQASTGLISNFYHTNFDHPPALFAQTDAIYNTIWMHSLVQIAALHALRATETTTLKYKRF